MNLLTIFIIILNYLIEISGFIPNIHNIKLRKNNCINMCPSNSNFINNKYITDIIPVVPNKTKISYITNNINYEIIVSIYSTYNNKNNLIFLNNGSYVEIYNRTVKYDKDKLQQTNIVSQAFYNRLIEYLYKSRNVTNLSEDNNVSKRLYK